MSESVRLMLPGYNRFASLVITAFGAIANFALAIQLLAAWRSLKWEPESEWEASSDTWRVDGVKVIWALLSTYFASAATVCVIGFSGIIKVRLSFVFRQHPVFTQCPPEKASLYPLLPRLLHCRLFILHLRNRRHHLCCLSHFCKSRHL